MAEFNGLSKFPRFAILNRNYHFFMYSDLIAFIRAMFSFYISVALSISLIISVGLCSGAEAFLLFIPFCSGGPFLYRWWFCNALFI